MIATRQRHIRTLDGKFCRVDGGTIPPQKCPKCRSDHERAYEAALLRLDRQANRGR
ncbi:hypothetical protein AA0Y32_06080 [Georgenia phoenicis]|uniref:hypothetical protein n=1 Tax=unclassified Georgenia TaxID=2626815 RepID=UPI0039AFC328